METKPVRQFFRKLISAMKPDAAALALFSIGIKLAMIEYTISIAFYKRGENKLTSGKILSEKASLVA